MTMSREVQPKPANRALRGIESLWDRVLTAARNPDLIAIVIFCAIGLLITLNVILRYPDFGAAAIEQIDYPLVGR